MELFEIQNNRFGKCIFSLETIPEGTVIHRFSGKPMLYDETKKLGDVESYALQTGTEFYLFLDEPARYFNHSCDPSCGLTPELELVALRDISKGEELNYDYSTTMLERDWHMKCHCNKEKCRQVITDFDRLPKKLQEHYLALNVVQQYIVDALNKKNDRG